MLDCFCARVALRVWLLVGHVMALPGVAHVALHPCRCVALHGSSCAYKGRCWDRPKQADTQNGLYGHDNYAPRTPAEPASTASMATAADAQKRKTPQGWRDHTTFGHRCGQGSSDRLAQEVLVLEPVLAQLRRGCRRLEPWRSTASWRTPRIARWR